MKLVISFLFTLISFSSFACECISHPFMVQYHQSDFIATAKILKVSGDELASEYRHVDIEIIELFKGEITSSIKEVNVNRNNCGIFTPENTTWLIFASKDSDGVLQIDACSGAQEIKEIPYDDKYPNYKKNVEANLSRTLEILSYLKKENLSSTNEYHLTPNIPSSCYRDLKGFECTRQTFSVFELTVQKDLSISNIKAVKEFDNIELSSKLFTCIKQNTIINTFKVKQIPTTTKVLVICFFYPAEGEYKSFISFLNL